MTRILVTGATGHIGSRVVAHLDAAGHAVRAVSRNPGARRWPARVEPAAADFQRPTTIDPCLRDVDAAFLVWTAPIATAADVIARIASRVPRIVLLTSPHRTPHPFFQQPNPLRHVHAELERLVEQSCADWTVLRPHVFALSCSAPRAGHEHGRRADRSGRTTISRLGDRSRRGIRAPAGVSVYAASKFTAVVFAPHRTTATRSPRCGR